ncbi:MAG: sulfotransferase family protein [Xenococcus sp. (in: cyanobacteria)]
MNKIFGIGFQKTGTTSLRDALLMLGYRVCDGCDQALNPNIAEEVYDICYRLVTQYDAFEDHPWSVMYRELDQKYPNSKFILTVRPPDQWLKSVVSHFGDTYIPLHQWIYGAGYPLGNEKIYLEKYLQHNLEVKEYFKDRPNDLLILQLGSGLTPNDLWKQLCLFLEHPISQGKFPYSNTQLDRQIINYFRKIKYKIYGKRSISFLGFKIGKNISNSA